MARLKQEPSQNLLIYGSAQPVGYLRQHQLIDQYRLMIFPTVLGRGKRLFGTESGPTNIKLVSSHPTSTGVVVLTYQSASA